MFEKIGKLVVKNRWWIIGFWLILAIVMVFKAPSLSQVGTIDEANFLPSNAESVKVKDVIKDKFPEEQAVGSGVIIFFNQRGLSEENKNYVKKVSDWLTSDQKPAEVEKVISAVTNPESEFLFTSQDETTTLIQVNFSTNSFDKKTEDAVKVIRERLNDHPADLQAYFSGQAGIGADLSDSIKQSVDKTTWATIILVIVLLLIIYRSPVASLVPLVAIGTAFIISRGVLGYLAQGGWKITSMLDSFLVVLIFGAGIDYCLFIVSRLKEELAKGNHKHEAVAETMTKISAVITASATTVIIGFLGLSIASFGMIKTIGPALAIAIGITLLAGLTLMPALMSIFGHKLFWPFPEVEKPHKSLILDWKKLAFFVTNKAKFVAPIVILLLLIPYLALFKTNKSFDILSEMPKDKESVQGFEVLEGHFDQGELMPLQVIIDSQNDQLLEAKNLSALSKISSELAKVEGVAKVRSAIAPSGDIDQSPFKVSNQLINFQEQIQAIAKKMATPAGLGEIKEDNFASLNSYLDSLSLSYPEVKEENSFKEAKTILGSLSVQIQTPSTSTVNYLALSNLQSSLEKLSQDFEALATIFNQKPNAYLYPDTLASQNPQLKDLEKMFVSSDKTTTRLYVILKEDPYSDKAFKTVTAVRETLHQTLSGTELKSAANFVGGPTAEFTDIQDTINKDFGKVMVIVVIGVLVVLIILLRSLIAPLYLMATVLLSYGATIGIVTWLFQDILGYNGISYIIPILLFVLLVALGADYNIFLSSRIKEESEKSDPLAGVRVASEKTGAIITACGIILAGTFATMAFAPLQMLFQIGLAVAIGILLDTFIVRAILVPAIATLLGKWNWWPSKIKKR